MLRLLPALQAFAKKHPKTRWVLALIGAVLAAVIILSVSCTVVSQVEPDGTGGWNVSLTSHVSGSRTVLPNRTNGQPATSPRAEPGPVQAPPRGTPPATQPANP